MHRQPAHVPRAMPSGVTIPVHAKPVLSTTKPHEPTSFVKKMKAPFMRQTSKHDWSRSPIHQEEQWVPPVPEEGHCGFYTKESARLPKGGDLHPACG